MSCYIYIYIYIYKKKQQKQLFIIYAIDFKVDPVGLK